MSSRILEIELKRAIREDINLSKELTKATDNLYAATKLLTTLKGRAEELIKKIKAAKSPEEKKKFEVQVQEITKQLSQAERAVSMAEDALGKVLQTEPDDLFDLDESIDIVGGIAVPPTNGWYVQGSLDYTQRMVDCLMSLISDENVFDQWVIQSFEDINTKLKGIVAYIATCAAKGDPVPPIMPDPSTSVINIDTLSSSI